jgi:4'-phosphopantetheinyl transferase EntD
VRRGLDRSLEARPGSLSAYVAYAMRRVGDPANSAAESELAALHPRTVEARRAAFLAGRTAAHAALADLGRDVPSILAGPMREPLWPDGIVGSVSHAGDVAIAIAAPRERTCGVGIDIEVSRPAPELWDQVPLPGEARWLRAIPDPTERARMLLALFSAKEAIYKAFFPRVGSYFGFEGAVLTPTSTGFTASLAEPIDSGFPPGRTFVVDSAWFGDSVLSWLVLPAR